MNNRQILGLVVIALGILALVYGGFTYTKETHDVELGPLELRVKEKERVNVPVWAGVAGIVVGLALLVYRGRRPSSS